MNQFSFLAAFTLLLLSGCSSVPITPATLATAPVPLHDLNDSLKRWTNAVNLCNKFLNSPYRKTLPKGQIRLSEDGMEFVTTNSIKPIRIKCTTWADYSVVLPGFYAQERSDGFVVGAIKPKRTRLIDNGFFKDLNGDPSPSDDMAELILHELTHSHYHIGTVSFSQGFLYYAEAVFLFRYSSHSMERLPFETTSEFNSFRYSPKLKPTPKSPEPSAAAITKLDP